MIKFIKLSCLNPKNDPYLFNGLSLCFNKNKNNESKLADLQLI